MKAALFTITPYLGLNARGTWPVPTSAYAVETAEASMDWSLEQFQLADELGFDWVSVAEHHFGPNSLTPNPMIMAGALAERVKRARIALLGANIPILNPVRVAEEFAMLDTLTHGRIIAGMLRGTPNEYVTYNISPAESRERFAEALQLILKAWTEPQPFGWQGRYFEYRSVSIWPRPVQQPHPPIYMSGSSPESAEFAARHRVGLGFAVTTVPLSRDSARIYREVANEMGWQPGPDDVIYRVPIYVAATDEQAVSELQSSLPPGRTTLWGPVIDEAVASAGYHGRDVERQRARHAAGVAGGQDLAERVANGQMLVGSPASVLRQMQSVREELGAGVFDLIFLGPGRDKTRQAIELFGTEVLPRLHAL